MTEERKMEIVKALAYGETPERAAAAEGIDPGAVQEIASVCAEEIAEEREMLRRAGYINE